MADFLEIRDRLDWTDGTQVNVFIDYLEEKNLYEAFSEWVEERFAEELEYTGDPDECHSCGGTGIGDPHSEGICRECSRREKSEPQEP